MIKTYINLLYKKIGDFSVLKRLLSEKEKVLTLVYLGPYAHKKLNFCLSAKIDLSLKKTNKFWNNFKITWNYFCVAIEKLLVIQFPYMKIV